MPHKVLGLQINNISTFPRRMFVEFKNNLKEAACFDVVGLSSSFSPRSRPLDFWVSFLDPNARDQLADL